MVEIYDTHDGTVYVATTIDDCKDQTDRMVFELVQEHGQVITCGSILGAVHHPTIAGCWADENKTKKV